MKIILDAWFDNNFGDDLFINTVLNRYPDAEFYAFWNHAHLAVLKRVMQFRNLNIMPGNCRIMDDMAFDGYVMVGGDVFMDGVDYSWRIQNMKAVKNRGGFVALQGFNLYEEYSDETIENLRIVMGLADVIVPRDEASAERLRRFVPGVVVTPSADMAFTGTYLQVKDKQRSILGIAPRRKYMTDDEAYAEYCSASAAIADGWLQNHPDGLVRFLAFSTGVYDDVVVSGDIIARMECPNQTEIVPYGGNLNEFLELMGSCTAMLPTRFHGMVFALIFGIPFVPMTYEVKLNQLLDELQYQGLRLPYAVKISEKELHSAVAALDLWQVDEGALARYYEKAAKFFAGLDALVQVKQAEGEQAPGDEGRFVCKALADARLELINMGYQIQWLKGEYDALGLRNEALQETLDVANSLYTDLLAKTNSFKGLAYLFAKKIYTMLRRGKA